MMTPDDLSIRTLAAGDVHLAVEWAAAEGWNPGLTDAGTFFASDPGAFLLGSVDDEPVSLISATRYGNGFGFLGFYIVRPELRGRGYGMRIWQAGAERLGARNTGLDGVLEQQANYEKSGFKLAYRNVRYEGSVHPAEAPPGLVDATAVPFERIAAFDGLHFLAPRPGFLRAWLNAAGTRSLAAFVAGEVAGYGVVRPARLGYKIGPVFAESAKTAESLIDGLLAGLPPGAPFYLDVPQPNREAVRLAEARGMSPVFETARMYNRSAPGLPLDRIYGVTSFELG